MAQEWEKTFFVKQLQSRLAEMGSSSVTVAFTGAAACNIPDGRTIHSTFFLPIHMKTSDKLPLMPEDQRTSLKSAMEGKAFLLIDEVSMVGPALLGMIHERLVQALECQLPFEGMSVIALGDFYQVQPCTPPALYSSLMDIVSGTREVGRPGYQQVGTNLFSGFKLFELKTQMRAREDSEHGSWVEAFRSGNMKPVDRAFIELLKSRQFSANDVQQDRSWAWATIGVTSNMEKRAVDQRQAKSFASAHGVPVIVWNKPVTSPSFLANSAATSGSMMEWLYREEAGLQGLFVKGAPAYLSKIFAKKGVSRGLANGTTCIMHSLTFTEETDGERAEARAAYASIAAARPGSIVNLGNLVPLSVNIEHQVTADEAAGWPMGGSLIHPVINRAANIGTVIIPVVCDHTDLVHTRAAGENTGWPGGKVKVKCHAVEPGFAITFHKLQGKTIPKVILDLRKRPGTSAGIKDVTFEGMYVGWTRVRKGADIRVIPPDDGSQNAYDHLMKLGPSAHLIRWFGGFPVQPDHTGRLREWNRQAALGMWTVMAQAYPASVPTRPSRGRRAHVLLHAADVVNSTLAEIGSLTVVNLKLILR